MIRSILLSATLRRSVPILAAIALLVIGEGMGAQEPPRVREPSPAKRVSPPLQPKAKRSGPTREVSVERSKQTAPVSPIALSMPRAGSSTIDLRQIPPRPPRKRDRPEREPPEIEPTELPYAPSFAAGPRAAVNAPAPSPIRNYLGLDFANWGAGRPPDPVGDVGSVYYIQAVNTSIGVFRKSDDVRVAAFTFDDFMSQGSFGNLCDTDNFGDPVVLYDTFEGRWVITDFAFRLNFQGDVISPPGAYQCFAVSKTSDPVAGGWNYYSLHLDDALNDYPKLGIWPDGIYMSANMFEFPADGSFVGTRVWALNKAQMYAGQPNVQVVQFSPPDTEFTLLPANARLESGTPPLGAPNYFSVVWLYTNAVSIYELHVDWERISTSSFTGPSLVLAPASWQEPPETVPAQNGTNNDTLAVRLMMQNQYTNIGGLESLWNSHTVRGGSATQSAVRYYQVDVTGGNVAANTTQAATWNPDAANRYMPSLAVDRAGNMALGYSASSSTLFPAIRYAGRLAGDPLNMLPQTETPLIEGGGSQNTSNRWGDYSAMSLDPDGCTFWYTNEYYLTTGGNWQTRIGSFRFPSCTTVSTGMLQGTVTDSPGGAPISGATVTLGSRATTTDIDGTYALTMIPAGTYPGMAASAAGYETATATNVVVSDGGTTTQDFAVAAAAQSGCLTDSTQGDFQKGIPTNVDLVESPGDVVLAAPPALDQQNLNVGAGGIVFSSTSWFGQTFTPALSGKLVKAEIDLFCSGCTGTTPDITVALRATTGDLPIGPDLATASIAGFSSAAGGFFVAEFPSPPTLTAGTRYALVVRSDADPSAGAYAFTHSTGSAYAGGRRVTSSDGGGVWTGVSDDVGFKIFVGTGYSSSGELLSGIEDANPAPGMTPSWSTLSWTAAVPAGTALRFQVAGSNSPSGPFDFVGPDGTSSTFFTTSGASLDLFYGFRYLQYRAELTTSDPALTPTLSDVVICYEDVDCSAVSAAITPDQTEVCPDSTGNTASAPPGASSYLWSITNGTITGGATSEMVTYTAGAAGGVGLTLTVSDGGGCHPTESVAIPILTVATPSISGDPLFCTGGDTTLTSSSAVGNQWYLDGTPIGGATGQTYVAGVAGDYSVDVTSGACTSAESALITVSETSPPAAPTITPGGSTTICPGASVTLSSSSAVGNQWYLDGNPIVGATSQTYLATAAGDYTVVATVGCASPLSSPITVTVNPTPAAPAITAAGPTTFCAGGSVTLTSSIASGNQWLLNGSPIGGATSQSYEASAAGNYSVAVTVNGCSSNPSAATSVTVNPNPSATITAPASINSGASGTASVPFAGVGAIYAWTITNGSFVGSTAGRQVNFTAGSAGTLTLAVTVTTATGCSASSGNVDVSVTTPPPPVTVTAISPSFGLTAGGTPVTISGTSFHADASVVLGGAAATSVVVNGSTTITAMTAPHALGAVDVTVTNGDATNATLANGFSYLVLQFDPNGDNGVDPSDIFYLVNYLFADGPAPVGLAGVLSGDANGDDVVDPADVFYVVNYLFIGGPQPQSRSPRGSSMTEDRAGSRISGAIALGDSVERDGRIYVPVLVKADPGSMTPQAIALGLTIGGGQIAAIRRSGAALTSKPAFETWRGEKGRGAYVVVYGKEEEALDLDAARSNVTGSVVAEIEIVGNGAEPLRLGFDPALTMLADRSGSERATVANGGLRLRAAAVGSRIDRRRQP